MPDVQPRGAQSTGKATIIAAMLLLAFAPPMALGGSESEPSTVEGVTMSETARQANHEEESSGKKRWVRKLSRIARASLADIEEYTDVAWRRFSNRLGINEPRFFANYAGYGNAERLWITGRLLANKASGGPMEDDNWFDNLQATYNRWNSNEIPDATVVVSYNGQTQRVKTDKEGYYHASFARDSFYGGRDQVLVEYRPGTEDALSALHTVYGPAPSSKLMVISDMDDTVIHTGITDLLLAAQLTFLNNARTRKPLTGVGGLYKALRDGPRGEEKNPIFYVSNSAWNMYDLLRDFVELNDIPAGPLLLRDIGFHAEGEGSENHKIETIRLLMERFTELPVLLVGDSGQHDADIYTRIVTEYPGRVLAVYIRDVDPDVESAYDARIDGIINELDGTVPFLRVANSTFIAEHAQTLGLLTEQQVAAIAADTAIDRQRDTLAEEAVEEAIPGDLPED